MSNYYQLQNENERKALTAWWHWLDENRGERAVLRRAASADDILLTPAFARFLAFMPEHWKSPQHLFDSAMVAGLLARIKEKEDSDEKTFAKALALRKQTGGKAAMSELRFLKLQKSRDPDEFFRQVTRAITLLGGRVHILSLADSILHWLMEYRRVIDREPTRRLAVRWATEYYTHFKD
ncbi:MAG: type I-E CRISPR-associated protein Cse2/CasB [Candidatus Thiodiazotropha sp.]